jgi:hypothetical protein
MEIIELIILGCTGCYFTVRIFDWYKRIISSVYFEKSNAIKLTLGFLPVVSFAIILHTLIKLASFDVAGSFSYTLFYLLLGLAWVFFGLKLVFKLFDLSWIDDALQNRNKAALFAVTGAFLGLTVIYSGANVGDGPGWWCVLFAGGLGITAWFLLSLFLNKFSQVFERITIERDMSCGIRFGSYLLASGLILGRASAGDWTSFYMTIEEFLVGWPVLILTLLALLIERYYINAIRQERIDNRYLAGSVFWGLIYIIIAVFSIMMFPLVENPAYGSLSVG